MRLLQALLVLLVLVTAVPAQAQGRRVALVIGNATYAHETRLANPGNDATAIAAALKRLKFDDVEVAVDADLRTMNRALATFARKADGADLALVYYSGHGIEVDGRNFLIPTDAKLADTADVDFEAVQLDLAVAAVDRANRVKVVILDACRNNPFRARMAQRQGRRSVGRGLAPVAPATGMLVGYAARAGTEADDGAPGGNSPYTTALLKHIETPGLDVRLMFGKVRDDVVRATTKQEPFIYGSLGGDAVYLATGPVAPLASAAAPQAPMSEAAQAWAAAKDTTNVAVLEAYVRRFGDSFYGDLARARIDELKQRTDTAKANTERLLADLEKKTAALTKGSGVPAPKCDGVIVPLGSGGTACLKPGSGQSFRDCPDCPEMVVVPAGSFMMGANDGEADEQPVRRVTLAKPFAVGKFEVTFLEWDACVSARGCKHKPNHEGWSDGKRPAINVSWKDITQEYLPWLNQKLGLSGKAAYRLLTEAEWEYAARAGTTTRYSWGNDIGTGNANCARCGSEWDNKQTAPVGKFKPNAFGLYDMHGNVREWVEDCYADSYAKAPTDGSKAPDTSGCSRVFRGGSWSYNPLGLRSADRYGSQPDGRYWGNGFRLARTLSSEPIASVDTTTSPIIQKPVKRENTDIPRCQNWNQANTICRNEEGKRCVVIDWRNGMICN